MSRWLLAILLSVVSCDESLPPRSEPQQFLQASYSVASGTVVVRNSAIVGLGGTFAIALKNIYSEVLQDAEFARVDLDVWLRDMPDVGCKVTATKNDLTDPFLIVGGQLTLRPNVSATFLKQWDHKTTAGRPFWEFVPSRPRINQRGEEYLESDTLHFVTSGKAQLFKGKAPEVLRQTQFSLVYWIF
jgi:hypothetical protein